MSGQSWDKVQKGTGQNSFRDTVNCNWGRSRIEFDYVPEREVSMSEKPKYYISTAIAYTSGKPHIGNTYEIALADAIARYMRSQGYDVYFQTGTDGHGQEIELNTKEADESR